MVVIVDVVRFDVDCLIRFQLQLSELAAMRKKLTTCISYWTQKHARNARGASTRTTVILNGMGI